MNNPTTPKSAPAFPDFNPYPFDLSPWGFKPGSDRDKWGVVYSADRKALRKGRKAKGDYEIVPTVTDIADEAFMGSDIETLVIPSGVRIIPQAMCKKCKKLHHVEIPHGVTEISGGAFLGCTSLAQIDIPASVKIIAIGAFSSCSNLKSVVVPDGCEIAVGAFPRRCTVITK